MKIITRKTKYHRFGFYFDFSHDVIEFCRVLKESFGWSRFSYCAENGEKFWAFSDSFIVTVIKENYPSIEIDPLVWEIVKYEQNLVEEETHKASEVEKIKQKKDSAITISGIKGELYPYQKVGVEFLIASKGRAIIADAPGCIAGDEEIIINRGGCARKYSIRNLFRLHNGKTWNLNIPTKTRTLSADGLFHLNIIKKVLYKGKKETVVVSAISDEGVKYSVRVTPDHRIATPEGWVEAGKLYEHDSIIVNGDKLSWCDICKNNTPHAVSEYIKKYRKTNYGKCKKCIYRFIRKNGGSKVNKLLPNNEHLDKSGYINVTNAYFHPSVLKSVKKNKAISKHVLVFEAYINDVSYEEWLNMCSTNNLPKDSLFVNSYIYAVHHKNKNKQDNQIGNLEYLTHKEHALEHVEDSTRNLTMNLVPAYAKITSIKKAGVTDVYDIQMSGADKNFITSGVVVHNCGKTVQALAYAQVKKFKRILVVSPASVKFAWASEIKKWTRMSSVIIDSKTKLHEIDGDIEFWVINYDILKRHLPQLSKIQFSLLIGDEVHFCKSVQAIRTKAFRMLSRNIPHVVLLSGTPLLSRPIELFSLLNILDPQNWNNYYDYARKFCAAKQTRFGLDVSGVSNAEELHGRIRGYFLRRTKDEVLKDLPPKNRIRVPAELDAQTAKKYNEAESNFVSYMKQYSGKQPTEIAKTLQAEKLTQLNVLRMLSARGKVSTALEIIESIVDAGEKIIVFSSFIEPIYELKQKFKDISVVLTGETPVEEREGIVKKFQEDKKTQVFFGGIRSAGVGITLTAASNVLFLDYPWNPADSTQAEDRAHRISQKAESVNIYQLHADGTIDDDMEEILVKKQKIFDTIIEGGGTQKNEKTTDLVARRIIEKYK